MWQENKSILTYDKENSEAENKNKGKKLKSKAFTCGVGKGCQI